MELIEQTLWVDSYFINVSKNLQHPYDYQLSRADILEKYSCYGVFDFSFLPAKYCEYMNEAVKLEDFYQIEPVKFMKKDFINRFYIKVYDHFNFDYDICEFVIVNFENMFFYGWDLWINMFKAVNYYIKN